MDINALFHHGSKLPFNHDIVIADYRDPTNDEGPDFESVIYHKASILGPWTNDNNAHLATPKGWAYAEELIPALIGEIERLRDDLETARKVAIEEIAHSNHLAAELEKVYANNQVCWEEPGESSPALIAHKNRMEQSNG